ncbi:hypothetical protein [Streptomyces sp. NPDC101776]|uniref:hypothetical protein n=1 Tax=Streptomyces sp. NPDC101776 TaxID=3366146 RepID=UPI00381E00FB
MPNVSAHLIDAATSPRRVADIVNVSSTAGQVARSASGVHNLTKSGPTVSRRRRVRVSVVELLQADDIADAIGCIVTRERRVVVNEMPVRAGDQTR